MAFIEGDRVDLVPLDPDDEAHVETYRRTRNEPGMRATGGYGRALTHEGARERIEEIRDPNAENAVCAILPTAEDDSIDIDPDSDPVGWVATYIDDARARVAEVAYYVLPEHQGEGYGTEATGLVVAYAFDELNAHKVEARVQADNPASERVCEKLGFEREGRRRKNFFKDGEHKDVTLWGVLHEEFTTANF